MAVVEVSELQRISSARHLAGDDVQEVRQWFMGMKAKIAESME